MGVNGYNMDGWCCMRGSTCVVASMNMALSFNELMTENTAVAIKSVSIVLILTCLFLSVRR